WVESSAWDGRYALVVAADIAIYANGPARPTGGAAAVAILVGPDAPIVIERGLRSTFVEHVYDFYKPDLASEYPMVDGQLSVVCYARALDNCYQRYIARLAKKENIEKPSLDNFDYMLFHSPYTKLVVKSFARLGFHDFLANPEDPRYANAQEFSGLVPEENLANRDLEKAFVGMTKSLFNEKVAPSLAAAKNIGNTYCASLYSCLISLICEVPSETLNGKRIGLFSYGSGSSSTLFSVRVVGSTEQFAKVLDIKGRLESRVAASAAEFDKAMLLREETHQLKNYHPIGDTSDMFPGTYYLTHVDEKFRRFYERKN
ncbi:3-hydroxy-3-methylglutaryl coenzyme A synthase, partial [Basidiobolus ranarum]